MTARKFSTNDRVRRTNKTGCLGTVKAIREEASNRSDAKDKPLLISVQWDNGTLSYFAPEALEPANG